MLTVCEKHIKFLENLLDEPYVQQIHQTYWEHSCIYCGEIANYKLMNTKLFEFSSIKKIKSKAYGE
jgi:hypothetical protein